MATYDKKELKQLLEDAVELADLVPEASRDRVLELLVEHLLKAGGSAVVSDTRERGSRKGTATETPDETIGEDLKPWETEVIEGLPEAHEVASGSRQQQTVWTVIYLLRQGKEAEVNAVMETIRGQLGVAPQSSNNTSRTLGDLVPKYLTREKAGKGYNYRPTRHALEIFED